jgi:hypothetical protein
MQSGQPTTDLFAIADNNPVRDWATLAKELEAFRPSLFNVWKKEYDCWKYHYQRFRDYEQATLFTAEDNGDIPKPSDDVMRQHRRAVLALFQSGEICADLLLALPLEGEQAQERLEWKRRLRTLLDSLQETLELWHPVNLERSKQRHAIFK